MPPPTDHAAPVALTDAAARMRSWLFDEALPLWAEKGLDRIHGGFQERLELDGSPDLATARRLRVQARQIYVFSHAHILGWSGPALEIVEAGYEFLTHRGWLDEGGWLHLFTPQGGVFDDRRDTYDHAFVLFALAWAHRALGRHDPLTWAERTLTFMDDELSDPIHGGYLEGLPPASPRRQNPHMHFLEAMLALYEATGEAVYVDRARKIVDLFRKHFFDARAGVLREYFADDFSALNDDVARLVEPGHHYEWVWLLSEYEAASGDLMGEYCDRLFDFAEQSGCDETGLARDVVQDDGAVVSPTRRLWPQTEALKACLVMRRTGRRDVGTRLETIVGRIFADYLEPAIAGGWRDQLSQGGAAVASHIPASTFYHLMAAFAPTISALEEG